MILVALEIAVKILRSQNLDVNLYQRVDIIWAPHMKC